MAFPDRSRTNPYRLYLGMRLGMSFLAALAFTTSVVYWVKDAGLNPFQLVVLGTVLEGVYFLLQLPTGLLADLVSRRGCVVVGVLTYAGGLVMQGASPAYLNLLLAQAVLALGAALMSGAQDSWAADELRESEMTPVFLRAARLGLVGTIAGSLLSGVLAMISLNAPLLVSGILMAAGGLALALLMPENHFHPRKSGAGLRRTVLQQAKKDVGEQLRASRQATRMVPGLFLLLGMTLFVGLWSESFDRLSGDFLLQDVTFPHVLGLEPAAWFSLISCVTSVLGFFVAGWAGRRTERLGSGAIVGMLLLFTSVTAVGVMGLSLAETFPVALMFLLLVSAARPIYEPLANGWLVVRVDSSVRATTLSARDMFDSGGQIVGGPLVGAIGSAVSVRAALMSGAAVLVPAIVFLLGLSRKAEPAVARRTPAEEPSLPVESLKE
ncbi:MAG: MFS transporter [Streptomyces sp.]|nr:MFS transporter [Streptomyces sp.]NUT27230.1 MFS transporter [Streptomyces sp.]